MMINLHTASRLGILYVIALQLGCGGQEGLKMLEPPLQIQLQATRSIALDGKEPNADTTPYTLSTQERIDRFFPDAQTYITVYFRGSLPDRLRRLAMILPPKSRLLGGVTFDQNDFESNVWLVNVIENPIDPELDREPIRTWSRGSHSLTVISRDGEVVRMRLRVVLEGRGLGSTIPQESADGSLTLDGEIAIDFANQETILPPED